MNKNSKKIVALLGPTNTGKTHEAIEKMLEFDTGIFGLPLRLPPGDRWQIGNEIFESLTECLNEIFIREQATYFEVDAAGGEIFIDDGKEAPKAPPKMWDLYGEKSE